MNKMGNMERFCKLHCDVKGKEHVCVCVQENMCTSAHVDLAQDLNLQALLPASPWGCSLP